MCAFCRLATALIALLFGLVVPGAAQLSASWTPSGDGPLPLSENYRTTLRKLCKLELKDSLPPKVRSASFTTVSSPLLPAYVLGRNPPA